MATITMTVSQETARIARNVELCNALAIEKPNSTTAKLAAQAQSVKTKQLLAQILPFYEQNTTLRGNAATNIATLEKAYVAAGGTGDPNLPVGSPTKRDDSVFTPVLTAASGIPGWLLAVGGIGVGYLVFKRK